MLKSINDLTNNGSKGLNTQHNIFALEKGQTPNIMDMKVNEDGSIERRLGSSTMNSVVIADSGSAAFSVDSDGSLTTDLISWWNLDETSGNRNDAFGTNHLSDAFLNVGYEAGKRTYAAKFISTATNYLTVDQNSTLNTGLTNFSISTWVYLTATGAVQTIVSKRDNIIAPKPFGGIDSQAIAVFHCEGSQGSVTSCLDSSQYENNLATTIGTVVYYDSSQCKFGTFSLLCSTGAFYVSVMSNFAVGTGDFTFECWTRLQKVELGGVEQSFISYGEDGASELHIGKSTSTNKSFIALKGIDVIYSLDTMQKDRWYHLAASRSSGMARFFVDGELNGSLNSTQNISSNKPFWIGVQDNGHTNYARAWIDEVRLSKGISRYNADFVVADSAFISAASGSNYEYQLLVNSDNIPLFRVSSSGLSSDGKVVASSFGALGTGTWYNIVAWHTTATHLGIGVNLATNTAAYTSGVRAGSAPLVIGSISNGLSDVLSGRVDCVGFWKKKLTTQQITDLYNSNTGNNYSLSFERYPWASFDFGANTTRWLMVSCGTGVYASSNLGVTWVTVASDRTATYQTFDRSKNVLINTTDAYNTPLYWAGSSGTGMAVLNVSAPLAKFVTNFQGFTILMNTTARKRGFWYEDETSHITGDWGDSFDLPSSADDEITGSFVLRRSLYVSTKYRLFRLTFVGGNPDWSYSKVKDFGYVPRTIKIIFVEGVGEVACGLTWDRRIRLFDGTDDKVISDPIMEENRMCDFALKKVSYFGSGLVVCNSEYDTNEQVYRLLVPIGLNSTNTTHEIDYNGGANVFYPFSNRPFNTMTMAESGGQRFLMAFDRNAYCHVLDSGNLDSGVTPINGVYDSSILYEKSPSEVSKAYRVDLYFSATSSGTLSYSERNDFSSSFVKKMDISLSDTTNVIQVKKSIDVSATHNVYQFRISTSSNTAGPWRLNRQDYFLGGKGIGSNP